MCARKKKTDSVPGVDDESDGPREFTSLRELKTGEATWGVCLPHRCLLNIKDINCAS